MTNRKARNAKDAKWPLCEFERAFSPQRVLITINPLRPVKGIKEKTLIQVNEKAAPILVEHLECRVKWLLRALHGSRWQKKPELCSNQFVGCVEALNQEGKRIPAHGHLLCEFRNEDRIIFKKKRNLLLLKIADERLKSEYAKLEAKLEKDFLEAGLDTYYKLSVDYRPHDGKKLDYFVKGRRGDCYDFVINPHIPAIKEEIKNQMNRPPQRIRNFRRGETAIINNINIDQSRTRL